jgi:hypothetical protein
MSGEASGLKWVRLHRLHGAGAGCEICGLHGEEVRWVLAEEIHMRGKDRPEAECGRNCQQLSYGGEAVQHQDRHGQRREILGDSWVFVSGLAGSVLCQRMDERNLRIRLWEC